MTDTPEEPPQPGRRSFIKGAAAGSLATAFSLHFPSAFGQQRGTDMAQTLLINGKVATLDPARPRATAVAHESGHSASFIWWAG